MSDNSALLNYIEKGKRDIQKIAQWMEKVESMIHSNSNNNNNSSENLPTDFSPVASTSGGRKRKSTNQSNSKHGPKKSRMPVFNDGGNIDEDTECSNDSEEIQFTHKVRNINPINEGQLAEEIRVKQEIPDDSLMLDSAIEKEIAAAKQHSVTRILKCIEPNCNWVFRTKAELDYHLQVGHGIKQSRCLQRGCDQSFDSK